MTDEQALWMEAIVVLSGFMALGFIFGVAL